MFGWSMFWFACCAFCSGVAYRLIEGYSQPGFARPIDYDEDGNEVMGGVWNDWWPALVLIALPTFICGVFCMVAWINNRSVWDE